MGFRSDLSVMRYGGAGARVDAFQVTRRHQRTRTPTPGGDGSSPNVRQALVEGVVAAKDEARRNGFEFQVGFAASPSFNPTDEASGRLLASRSTPAFCKSLDYVGLDSYPDVFRPIPRGPVTGGREEGVFSHFRQVNLVAAGIGAAVPVRVTENGWPTGPGGVGRSASRSARDRRACG